MNKLYNPHFMKAFLFIALQFFTIAILSAQLPSGFIDAKVQGGYTSPMGVAFSKDGRLMFVWEKKGTLWVSTWNGVTYVKQSTVTLDISPEVGDWRDFGFQSVALDPNFDSNGLIYLYYQVDRHHLINFGTAQYSATTNEYFKASISRITRYKLNNNNGVYTADNASRKILLGETKSTGVPLLHESHAGGQIVFGTDGTLMVSTGDNASYASIDVGNASETYYQQALNDGIIRSTENVGAFKSQLINSFCGKVLRIDPNTGNGIPSNPYYDAANPRSAKSCVWALGLRNPYRMSFKKGTGSSNPADGNPGTLIVVDVGYGSSEDMQVLEKGGLNCGWPLYEGLQVAYSYLNSGVRNQEEANAPLFKDLCVQPTTKAINATPSQRRYTHFPPALDWLHGQDVARYPDFSTGSLQPKTIGSAGAHVAGIPFRGNAGTAGTYYDGTAFPANYRNVYFFADYGANWIKAAVLHDNSDHQAHEVRDFAPAGYGKGIVDVEYCPLDQSIFYVNINTGDIQKISFGSGNRPPIVNIGADKTSGASPLTVNFNSNGTSDPDGDGLSYSWDFGDGGAKSTAPNPQRTFTSTGSRGYTVTLTVTDSRGLSDSKSITISVNNTPPSVKITNPVNNAKYTLTGPTNYTLQSNVTDNDTAGMQYAWQVTLRHNNHEHREPVINQKSPTVQISPVGCDGETYYYLIELQVTDKGGLTARDSVKIYPDCSSQNLSISNLKATPQTNAIAVSWTNPNVSFDEVMVVAKANSGFLTNPNGTNYTANSNFTGNGTAFEGGKVVYRGTGTSVTVTGLTAGTRYYFRVFTRKGTSWNGGTETSAIPNGSTPPTQQLGCLKGSYYNNLTFSGTPVVRAESSVNYDWATGAPISGINADNFSVRWEGTIIPTTTGSYTFVVTADDGVRLWVNNTLIIDKWIDQPATQWSGSINLTANQRIPIKLEYYERGGLAVMRLNWIRPGQSSAVIGFNACSLKTPNFDPNQCYRLTNLNSNLALIVPNASTARGTQLTQLTFNKDARHHVWRLKNLGDGSYRIVNGNSGLSVDVYGAQTTDNSAIIQWDWHGENNQRWIFTRNSSGYYEIKAKHSGKVMDILNSSTAQSAKIVQYLVKNTNSQQWKVESVGCPAGVVAIETSEIYAADGYKEGRKAVITWVSNANDADYFVVERMNQQGDFESLSYINALPYTQESARKTYHYVDNQPFEGRNIYRVKLVAADETHRLSKNIALDFHKIAEFAVFPNPAYDYIDVDIESYSGDPVLITVVDALGKELKHTSKERADNIMRVELEGLPSGQYILKIKSPGKRDVSRIFNITR